MTIQHRNDDAQGVWFREQLTVLESDVMKKEYGNKTGRLLLPVDNTGGPGVAFKKYRLMDRLGVAKAINEAGDDLPLVSLTGQEFTNKAQDYGIGAAWSQRELDEAQFAKTSLEADLLEAARDGYEDKVDELIWTGDSARGVQGLMDHPNIPIYTPGTSAGAGDDTWPNKTAEEMIADVRTLLSGIKVNTKNLYAANLVWASPERLDLLSTTYISGGSKTAMEVLKGAFPGVIFDSSHRLTTASAAGAQRLIAMFQDKKVAHAWEPQPFSIYPAQQKNFKYIVPCKGAFGGVIVKRPMAIAFMDGV